MDQQQIMQFQMLEQEANKLAQQLQLIENNLSEIQDIKEGLEEIDKKETKEILANIGKKIYIPVEIKDKNLIIEIGNKKFVKKSIPETRKLIEEQVNKMNHAKQEITNRLEDLQEEANNLMQEYQKAQGHKHKHDDENCDCNDDCECEDDDCECKKE